MGQGLYKNRGHLGPAQVTACEDEGPDASSDQGRLLGVPISNPGVLRDDGPSSATGLGKPLIVARVLCEVLIVSVDDGSLRTERRGS